MDKREMLGLGNLGNVNPSELEGDTTKMVAPGSHVISLGVPLGNKCGQFEPFWAIKYRKSKNTLTSVRNIEFKHTSGKHKLVNGNMYGTQRYWLWSMDPPQEIVKATMEDARQFLWRADPELDLNELGSKKRLEKWVSNNVEYKALKAGGLGFLHWPSHLKAFKARWIALLFDPRRCYWKELLDEWLKPYPRSILIQDLSKADKKYILGKIPKEHLRKCIRAFWDLELAPAIDLKKIESPDDIRGFPTLRNGLYKMALRRSSEAVWLHPVFNTLGQLYNDTHNRFMTEDEIKQLVRATIPEANATLAANLYKRIRAAMPNALTQAMPYAPSPTPPEKRGPGSPLDPRKGSDHRRKILQN